MLSRLRLGENTVASPTVKFTARDTASTGRASATAVLNSEAPSMARATQEPGGATPMPWAKECAKAANIHTGPPAAMKPSRPAQSIINLLSGSFSGVQFQVGANEGQTLTLSIGNLTASAIGLNASTVSGATVYGTNVKATSAALTLAASAAKIASGGAGKFTTAGSLAITGQTGGNSKVAVTKAQESAASLASAINGVSGSTGVQAQATTSITLALGTAGAGAGYSFAIQAGKGSGGTNGSAIGTKQTITASSAAQIVGQINGQSSTSGIVASLTGTTGQIQLTQTAGYNINITGTSSGSLKTVGGAASTIKSGAGTASAVIQGQVQFQSSGAFTVGNAANIGLSIKSTLTSLSSINVSTTSGANTAINVVKYALGALNNQGGQLGAVQQALTANINNLNATSQNLTTALGVVQDANIPAVSNQLVESQIQAQSGVAALKSSTQLQQSYLSLLP